MKPFTSIKYMAALLPALAVGISTASADDAERDRPCDDKHANVHAEKDHGQQMAERNHDQKMVAEKHDQKMAEKKHDQKMAEKKHDQRMADKASQASAHASAVAKSEAAANSAVHAAHYLATKPTGNYFSGNIVGHDVMNRRDNKVIGTVDELLIDRNGQIGAVIISTGGIMGMGKKDLAIAWDQIERKTDGEKITLSVDLSDASLADAPSFASN